MSDRLDPMGLGYPNLYGTAPTPDTEERAHERLPNRPEWAVGDWHCRCGWWGSHGWEGFANHLVRDVLAATPPQADRGLREALDRMERTLPQYVDMDGLHWWPCKSVRDILRDTPPAGLDVETLARAIHAGADGDCDGTCNRAAEIAAEYARLREQADA